MRRLLQCTVRTAVAVGILDLAVQAIGGITATDVVNSAVPMLEQAEEMIWERLLWPMAAIIPQPTQGGDLFVMPERYQPGVQGPYFKDKVRL